MYKQLWRPTKHMDISGINDTMTYYTRKNQLGTTKSEDNFDEKGCEGRMKTWRVVRTVLGPNVSITRAEAGSVLQGWSMGQCHACPSLCFATFLNYNLSPHIDDSDSMDQCCPWISSSMVDVGFAHTHSMYGWTLCRVSRHSMDNTSQWTNSYGDLPNTWTYTHTRHQRHNDIHICVLYTDKATR